MLKFWTPCFFAALDSLCTDGSGNERASLRKLALNDTTIEELPDLVRSLRKLEFSGSIRCVSLTEAPEFVGHLESLKELYVDESGNRGLPVSMGDCYTYRPF